MCSGRVDLQFIIRAFLNNMDGVFIGGCRLNECNYTTQGNYYALGLVNICKKVFERIGLDPERLEIRFMSSADGILFVKVVHDFVKKIRELGPLGVGEGVDQETLRLKLQALSKLVPYIRLVERERLRVTERSEKAYEEFFASKDVERLIDELIIDKVNHGEIMTLLGQRPLSTAEISERLGQPPSEVLRYLNSLSRQGFVRFDLEQKRFAVA